MCCDRYPGQNLLYGMRKGRRHAWATRSFAISQRTWRSFGKIALDPAIDRAALHSRMFGDDGNRLASCDLGNRRPKAVSSDIRNPAVGDIENPATSVMLMSRSKPLRL
jgi:hypothetical protein